MHDIPTETVRDTALVLCHSALIDKYLEKIRTCKKVLTRNTQTDYSAYYSGMGDGRSISLNRQIKRRMPMKVFWIVFATVYILGWVWLCYSAMHAPSDLDLWGEEIE